MATMTIRGTEEQFEELMAITGITEDDVEATVAFRDGEVEFTITVSVKVAERIESSQICKIIAIH